MKNKKTHEPKRPVYRSEFFDYEGCGSETFNSKQEAVRLAQGLRKAGFKVSGPVSLVVYQVKYES